MTLPAIDFTQLGTGVLFFVGVIVVALGINWLITQNRKTADEARNQLTEQLSKRIDVMQTNMERLERENRELREQYNELEKLFHSEQIAHARLRADAEAAGVTVG